MRTVLLSIVLGCLLSACGGKSDAGGPGTSPRGTSPQPGETPQTSQPAPITWDASPDPGLQGYWDFVSGGLEVRMRINTDGTIGYLEAKGINYTCDRTLDYKTARTLTPAQMKISGASSLVCTYQLGSSGGQATLSLTCQTENGSPNWDCVIPKDWLFQRLGN